MMATAATTTTMMVVVEKGLDGCSKDASAAGVKDVIGRRVSALRAVIDKVDSARLRRVDLFCRDGGCVLVMMNTVLDAITIE